MQCLSPNSAYMCGTIRAKDGIQSPHLVFSFNEALEYYHGNVILCQQNEVGVPCGKCGACLIRKRKDMAVRLSHELSQTETSCFLTLTYNDDFVPRGTNGHLTLVKEDVQKFLKRLRARLDYYHIDTKFRYFAVGEYGSKTHRPHYHLILFGFMPNDLQFLSQRGNNTFYTSNLIGECWKFGFHSVSDCSTAVSRYCARYVTKKFVNIWTPDDDQLPEFSLASKSSGGIGSSWIGRYSSYVADNNIVNVDYGKFISTCSVPRFYVNYMRKYRTDDFLRLRAKRVEYVKSHKNVDVELQYDNLYRSVECQFLAQKTLDNNSVF